MLILLAVAEHWLIPVRVRNECCAQACGESVCSFAFQTGSHGSVDVICQMGTLCLCHRLPLMSLKGMWAEGQASRCVLPIDRRRWVRSSLLKSLFVRSAGGGRIA